MTATGAKGRSFPFEDLVTQTHNAKDHKRVSKKLSICNHSGPPFPGDKAPKGWGTNHLPFETVVDTLYELLSSGDARTVREALEPQNLAVALRSVKDGVWLLMGEQQPHHRGLWHKTADAGAQLLISRPGQQIGRNPRAVEGPYRLNPVPDLHGTQGSSGHRFGSMELARCAGRFIPREETQFAALTVLPGDGSVFLAFRGTDGTLVGWKEDFNLSFMDVVPAQLEAAGYIQDFAASFPGQLRLGGHSKGGNLAAAGGALSAVKVRDRIASVWSLRRLPQGDGLLPLGRAVEVDVGQRSLCTLDLDIPNFCAAERTVARFSRM
mgnify:CR=1 FL=1